MSAMIARRDGHATARGVEGFKAAVQRWASRIGVIPRRVQIQRMTTKWASCSAGGRLCFSADLLREDEAFRDVVIVHELLHLLVPNHGKLFKGLMSAYLPGWERTTAGRASRVCGSPRLLPAEDRFRPARRARSSLA